MSSPLQQAKSQVDLRKPRLAVLATMAEADNKATLSSISDEKGISMGIEFKTYETSAAIT